MHEKFNTSIAIILLVTAALACSMLRPKPPLTWHLLLQVEAPAPDRVAAVRQTIQVIQKRLLALGVSNWAIIVQGGEASGRLLVKLSDVPDPERLKQVITAGGKLELTSVISPPSPAPAQTFATKEEAIASMNSNGTIPENRRVLPYRERTDPNGPSSVKWVLVESQAIVDASDLRDARAARSSGDDYEIQFSLSKAGAGKFGDWTGSHINQYLGVVLNDEVKTIALIKSQISDQGVISGRFTKQNAEDLALVLKSGALPARVLVVEEKTDKAR